MQLEDVHVTDIFQQAFTELLVSKLLADMRKQMLQEFYVTEVHSQQSERQLIVKQYVN